LRAAGVAEISGFDRSIDIRKASGVLAAAKDLFPGAGEFSRVSYWAGLRPMTPDGPPYLGQTHLRNLILNLGQGSNGWTQACGCAKVIADMISGRKPDVDLDGLTLAR
jgi:D-amino-acid dehydrogenase